MEVLSSGLQSHQLGWKIAGKACVSVFLTKCKKGKEKNGGEVGEAGGAYVPVTPVSFILILPTIRRMDVLPF